MSGFTGLGENIRAAGMLAPTDTCRRPHPGRPLPPVEQPIRPHHAGRRTVGFWLIATLTTLGAVAALSAHTLAQNLAARTDQEITRASELGGLGGAGAGALPDAASLPFPPLGGNDLVLVLDAEGRVVERHRGSEGLPAFPALTPARLKAYAARPNPSAFGESYRAKVVRVPETDRRHPSGYVVTARSTVEDRRAVERLLQVETAAAFPLLATVLLGARRLGRREVREREDTERRLREFMAAAGHELRNPLTTISGYAELARVGDPAYEPMRQEALGRIATEVGRMSTLIDELVLLTRLDLGQPLQLTCVDLAQLCRDAVSAARDCHPDRPVRLLLAPGDHTVTGDPLRLHQLVANLLANARVHTPPGTTTTLGLGTEDGHRVIEILDDGPGIPDDLRARLFDPFVRGEETRAAGSGLGLSIVAAIATAHGGTITLEPSHPSHRGAWFRVLIPASS
ncbi:sensor histidine kinase [Streptomyces stelliscabiei]|uniref:histidine kinase n=1 Tax=Streptomyces stelliscabiei TaxID=146820 RepID=A0A8I0P3A6_9ACTN|nr:HAMP domain-containing sensor histidine kinase [Streptomyces stelliscabiei]KND44027.1 histidine kinase [Streptomyces stelliscabiei]MBE1598663.1 signal transduction histidine kinase [Streptomyces stelliscabiei]MDX2516545.1 HAMP domain-containing sensor histidine kinase [Streptomyces stelliscabiei]